MKDGEVVFLIAGFAALAFLMTKDKSGEEKPSQGVIDEFGPADVLSECSFSLVIIDVWY